MTTPKVPDITLYTCATPNGFKISAALEELGLPYQVRPVDLSTQEQKQEWFLKHNPNGRLPAITDGSTRVFESGAILLYLAEKYDSTARAISYAPDDMPGYTEQLSWLFWQMAGLGPMQGQAHHFSFGAPVRSDYGRTRYVDETKRLYSVLNTRLGESAYVAGEKFTIADISMVFWVRASKVTMGPEWWPGLETQWPFVKKWFDKIMERDAIKRALKVPETKMSEEDFARYVEVKRGEMMQKKSADLH